MFPGHAFVSPSLVSSYLSFCSMTHSQPPPLVAFFEPLALTADFPLAEACMQDFFRRLPDVYGCVTHSPSPLPFSHFPHQNALSSTWVSVFHTSYYVGMFLL
jgi:hypothetical protein